MAIEIVKRTALASLLALGLGHASLVQAENLDWEDSDPSEEGYPEDFDQPFEVDGVGYRVIGSINFYLDGDGNDQIHAAMYDTGAPTDVAMQYYVKCGEYWELIHWHLPYAENLIDDYFDPHCHIDGEIASAGMGTFFYGQ
jgi:hypothetical protein